MDKQIKRHDSMEPLHNHGQPPNAELDETVLQKKNIIQGLCCFTFIYSTIFLQALCLSMLSKVCSMDGIEAPTWAQQSIIAYYVFSLLFLANVYTAVVNVNKSLTKIIFGFVIAFGVALIGIGAVAIILYGVSYDNETDVTSSWNKLTQLRKNNRFDSDINNLLDKVKQNLLIIAVYHLIHGFLFIVIGCFLLNYLFIMPEDWRPPFSSRLIEPMPLIYVSAKAPELEPKRQSVPDEEPPKEEQENQEERPQTVFQQKQKSTRFQRRQQKQQEQQQPNDRESQPKDSEINQSNAPF